ncbi:4Fe-4S dicluster domain-containing protein [Gemmobacter lanyuensis]
MGIATTPFRAFNAPEGDPLAKAFRCNGNAQCLSYAAATPMCPSFKATADLRHSPKGRADALRDWHRARTEGSVTPEQERDLLAALDGCLGCKACASNCPVQVDIPSMRTVFLADYHHRHRRPIADRLVLAAERFSPLALRAAPILAPVWPLLARVGARMTGSTDLPRLTRQPGRRWIPGRRSRPGLWFWLRIGSPRCSMRPCAPMPRRVSVRLVTRPSCCGCSLRAKPR